VSQQAPHSCASGVHTYRPFFVIAVVFMLTSGITWAMHFLWQIASSGKPTGVNLPHINAHGHTLIYGFFGLFILGFAMQSFHRLWQHPLVGAKLVKPALVVFVLGILLHVVAQVQVLGTLSPWVALLSGSLETIALLAFSTMLLLTWRRGGTPFTASTAATFIGLGFFLLHTPLGSLLTFSQLAAGSRYEMIHITSVYQPAVRYLEYHGMTLLIIIAVGARVFPNFYTLSRPSERKLWIIVLAIALAAVTESALFLAMRLTESRLLGSLMLLPWLTLLGMVLWLVIPWKLWKPFESPTAAPDRAAKFVRAAWAWLVVAIVMTIALPFWSMLMGTAFSHAFHGATRQAFTVGFATMMILGFAARIVPNLNGIFPNLLPPLRGVFLLINIGLMAHVGLLVLSDLWAQATLGLPLAGLLQFIGITWWSIHILRCIRSGVQTPSPTAPPTRRSVGLQVVPS
jgi:hypothetical protein